MNSAQATAPSSSLPNLADLVTEPSWQSLVAQEASKQYWHGLEAFVQQEWQRARVFPEKQHIFRALNSVPVQDVKVVILGQVHLYRTFNPGLQRRH